MAIVEKERKDWKNRSPRWRVSLRHADMAILQEIFSDYFNRHPEQLENESYENLYQRILDATESIDKPLTYNVEDFPMEEW